ncbi:uncharacterized protein YkwD [Saccharothrix coeruleofusca]|uniref:CAP domain-containing protein n=1 Tax=Saccharothrix coeruleofusca TaxID=33919 RepID=UPI001AE6D607|nr:CAP domain-containing protein [Saccharothrix coeruleofusca]MBP2338563.1 uncharacterized protein YkwD [Saccharothrix coeruleofusca]
MTARRGKRSVAGVLVGLLLGAAGATGVAFASPVTLARLTPDTTAQDGGSFNIGLGGIGGIGEPATEGGGTPTGGGDRPPASSATTTTTTTTTTTSSTTTTTTTTAETTSAEPSSSQAAPQAQATTTTPSRAVDASQAQWVVQLVNEAREAAGCRPLKVDDRITAAAKAHSTDMATRGYFSHTTPEGVDFATRMRAAGYSRPGGENIAKGQRNAEDVMKSWMNSDGHRRNILDCSFVAIGVGLDTRGWYWTQNFGR